jgi:cell division FtsZ-interacting protein ZapD
VNPSQILCSLERERLLLQEFRSLCGQQLALLDVEDLAGVNSLLDQRANLMLELTAIEATLGTWIDQVRADPTVSPEMMGELESVNEEIVSLARMVVEIDEQTHWRLDFIRTRSAEELRTLSRGSGALNGYGRSVDTANTPTLRYLS